ncbi:MAG TPA: UDP-N-acetylmuramoyl-tripeptide--D-alanyl-D-alanine ligase [Longimicrobiales bacterium]
MNRWNDVMVREALGLGGTGDPTFVFTSVSTDSRTVEPGSLFVALKGERFDAHNFLADVAAKGASAAVVTHVPLVASKDFTYYQVPDTLVALGQLGLYRRRKLGAKLCAVTGSNGKTTTKEILKAMLSARYQVHATTGNLNNLIGVPLTLLAAPDGTEVIVAELGTNSPGEIAQLAKIVEADVAVVTAISEEHLEGLGDLRGVLEEETALLPSLPSDGVAVVADEPPELAAAARAKAARVRVAGWSQRADADLRAERVDLDENGNVIFEWQGRSVQLPLRGRHNARNALVAMGIALHWDVAPDAALAKLAELKPAKMRGELQEIGGARVIVDCYNSNPASLTAAIDLLSTMPHAGQRIAIVGSMLELGSASGEIHERAAQEIVESNADVIVATGAFAGAFERMTQPVNARIIVEEDPIEAYEQLRKRLRGDELILLKGSRGVALERLLPRLAEDLGVSTPHGEAARLGARSPHAGESEGASSQGHSHWNAEHGSKSDPAPGEKE